MGTTFLKRQKEMKRLEKQKAKAERRAQKKLAGRTHQDEPAEITGSVGDESSEAEAYQPPDARG
jgi:hypothetical protein